jgi:hypothetical protein
MPPGDDQTPLKHVEVTVKTHCFYECFVLMVYHSAVQHISATLRNIAWIFINVCFQSFQCVSWYDYLCNDLTNIKLHVSVLGINNLLTDPVKHIFICLCIQKQRQASDILIQGLTLWLLIEWHAACIICISYLCIWRNVGWYEGTEVLNGWFFICRSMIRICLLVLWP